MRDRQHSVRDADRRMSRTLIGAQGSGDVFLAAHRLLAGLHQRGAGLAIAHDRVGHQGGLAQCDHRRFQRQAQEVDEGQAGQPDG